MTGLSDEEADTLAAAKEAMQAAKAVIDRLEDKARRAGFEAILKRKRKQPDAKQAILSEARKERQDFPKPASRIPSHPKNRWNWKPPAPPTSEAIRETFDLVRSFGGLAATYSLDRNQTMKALRDAGIDIYEAVGRE
ncbi:MAG: hypothetical protein ACK5LJ_07495 [Paracoccus sp. (in: a-proteobacteria)]